MPDESAPQPDAPSSEHASVALPPWGSETIRERLDRLRLTARALPRSPGVYLLKDHKGVVLYIGKASTLPDRVSSYFLPSADLGPKKQPMLEHVHEIDVIVCAAEWEALLAESRLIKDINPKFNERLTDGKTFPYLVITKREDFPRIFVTRNPTGLGEKNSIQRTDSKDAPNTTPIEHMKNARVFGPFTNVGALRDAVQCTQRVFKFRTCSLNIIEDDPKNRFFRPCILHAIGQCTAPCANHVSKEAYAHDIDRFIRFLGSKRSALLREMRAEMAQASADLRFEEAGVLRDQISAIEKLDDRATRSDAWQPETENLVVDPTKGLRSLQRTLELDEPIRCIEGIDIAHLQGGETVGSKVCFLDGRPFKNEYRRYKIRTVEGGNDDYASIREVVSRRYREAATGNELYPDVILIDGGLGQLHAAIEALRVIGATPPMVISLAKKEELIYVQARSEPIRLGRTNAGLRLCQAVRDEAHRFAQHYHHVLRRKKTFSPGSGKGLSARQEVRKDDQPRSQGHEDTTP